MSDAVSTTLPMPVILLLLTTVIAIFGGVLSILIGLVALFLRRLMVQLDKNTDAIDGVKLVLSEVRTDGERTSERLKEMNYVEELTRTRIHWIVGKLGVLKNKAEREGKWQFADDEWVLPDIPMPDMGSMRKS